MSLTLQVNKAEFGQNSFDLLPEGDYELQLLDVKVEPFAKKGNYTDISKYSVTWKVTENNEVGVGRRIFDNIAIIEKWRNEKKTPNTNFASFCRMLGVEPDEDGTLNLPDAETILDSDWIIHASIVIEEDKNGQYDDRNAVSWYLTPERFEKSKRKAKAPETTASTSDATGGNPLFSV